MDPLKPIPPPLMCAGGSFVNMRTFRGSLYFSPHTAERLAVFLFHVAASGFVEVAGGRASRGQTES